MTAAIVDWFPYRRVALSRAEPSPYPLVPVVLRKGTRAREALGLVDSGAETCLLPFWVTRRLHCAPTTFPLSFNLLTESCPAAGVVLDLTLHGPTRSFRFPETRFLVPPPGRDFQFAILGREPFFERFEIRFREYQQSFGLVEKKSAWLSAVPQPVLGAPGA